MWSCWELPLGAHGQTPGFKAVQVGHDQQQVGRGLDGKEAAARYIYSQSVVKAFYSCTNCCLELDDVLATIKRLMTAKTRDVISFGKVALNVLSQLHKEGKEMLCNLLRHLSSSVQSCK